jgi:hypothetical protein
LLCSGTSLNSTEVGDIGGVGCSDDLADWTDNVFLKDLFSFSIDCRESLRGGCLTFFEGSGNPPSDGNQGPDNLELVREASGIGRKGLG